VSVRFGSCRPRAELSFHPTPTCCCDSAAGAVTCAASAVPQRQGQACIRLCSCGEFYAYNGNRWKPMSQFHLWLRRQDLAGDMGWLLDGPRSREWYVQSFPWWRRLLLRLQGWDAMIPVNPAGAVGSAGTRCGAR
jgi:hypothetical protein